MICKKMFLITFLIDPEFIVFTPQLIGLKYCYSNKNSFIYY